MVWKEIILISVLLLVGCRSSYEDCEKDCRLLKVEEKTCWDSFIGEIHDDYCNDEFYHTMIKECRTMCVGG